MLTDAEETNKYFRRLSTSTIGIEWFRLWLQEISLVKRELLLHNSSLTSPMILKMLYLTEVHYMPCFLLVIMSTVTVPPKIYSRNCTKIDMEMEGILDPSHVISSFRYFTGN